MISPRAFLRCLRLGHWWTASHSKPGHQTCQRCRLRLPAERPAPRPKWVIARVANSPGSAVAVDGWRCPPAPDTSETCLASRAYVDGRPLVLTTNPHDRH